MFSPADACMPGGGARHHPPRLIWYYLAGKKVSEQEFQRPHQNHLLSINAKIDHHDDGDVHIA